MEDIKYYSYPSIDYSKASVMKRIIAFIIDWIIYTIPLAPGVTILALNTFNYREIEYTDIFDTEGYIFIGILITLIGYSIRIIYSFIKDGFSGGQSYGKKIMGLRVIDFRTNKPISKRQSIIRRFIYIGMLLVPIIGLFIEPLLIIIDNNGRRFGDKVAGTIVIKDEEYIEIIDGN